MRKPSLSRSVAPRVALAYAVAQQRERRQRRQRDTGAGRRSSRCGGRAFRVVDARGGVVFVPVRRLTAAHVEVDPAAEAHDDARVGAGFGVADARVDLVARAVVGAEVRAADVRPDAVERHEEREVVALVEAALVAVRREVDALKIVHAVEARAPHPEPPVDGRRDRRREVGLRVFGLVEDVAVPAQVLEFHPGGDGERAEAPAAGLPAVDRWRGILGARFRGGDEEQE